MSENKNMDIWNRNCITEGKYTKEKPGGFKLTAIDAQYQLRMATEEFGAMGEGFGMKDERFEIHDGILFYQAIFWWIRGDEGGEYCMFSDIKVEANRDIAKKVQTSALSKAFSRLGFNADVYLNEFIDNEYVEEGAKKPKTAPKPRREPSTPKPVKDAGVEFEPVTDEAVATGVEIELDSRLSSKSRKSAIEIINAGRGVMDEKEYYEVLFTYEGKCFVHSEADFLEQIQFSLSKGWETDRKYYAISRKAQEYADANGIPF